MSGFINACDKAFGSICLSDSERAAIEDSAITIKVCAVAMAVFAVVAFACGISFSATVVGLPLGIAFLTLSSALGVLSRDAFIFADNWKQAKLGGFSKLLGMDANDLLKGTIVSHIPGSSSVMQYFLD
jgi:hypothetical protein